MVVFNRNIIRKLRRSVRLKSYRRFDYKEGKPHGDLIVSEDGTLHLYLKPPPVQARRPHLTDFPSVNLEGIIQLTVKVTGIPCPAMVDSGCSSAFMSHTHARALGLLDQIDKHQEKKVLLWTGKETINLGKLRNVPVTLGEDITIPVNFLVNPQERGHHPIVLDTDTMKRLGAMMSFSSSRSTLHFRRLGKFRQPTFGFMKRKHRYFLEGHVKKDFKDRHVSIHIDSGAEDSLYISSACLKSGGSIRRVAIHLSDSKVVLVEKINEILDNSYDVILGAKFLGENNCVLDYYGYQLHVQHERHNYQLKLHSYP